MIDDMAVYIANLGKYNEGYLVGAWFTCQEYYFDFEAYASHLQEHGKFLVTEHAIFELPE